MDYSPAGSSVHGILQARILEWVAMPSSRGSSAFKQVFVGTQALYTCFLVTRGKCSSKSLWVMSMSEKQVRELAGILTSALTPGDLCAWERDEQGHRVASGECTSSKAVSIKQKAEPATWGQSQRLRNLDCSLSLNPGAVFTDQVMLQLCLKSSSGYFSWVAIWNLSDFHIYYDLALIFSSFFFFY